MFSFMFFLFLVLYSKITFFHKNKPSWLNLKQRGIIVMLFFYIYFRYFNKFVMKLSISKEYQVIPIIYYVKFFIFCLWQIK